MYSTDRRHRSPTAVLMEARVPTRNRAKVLAVRLRTLGAQVVAEIHRGEAVDATVEERRRGIWTVLQVQRACQHLGMELLLAFTDDFRLDQFDDASLEALHLILDDEDLAAVVRLETAGKLILKKYGHFRRPAPRGIEAWRSSA